jgi:hypothetical protein
MLTHNVGTTDRVIRLVLGVVLLSLFFVLDGGARYLGLIGLIPLVTAMAGTCPLYSIFGASTCPTEKKAV